MELCHNLRRYRDRRHPMTQRAAIVLLFVAAFLFASLCQTQYGITTVLFSSLSASSSSSSSAGQRFAPPAPRAKQKSGENVYICCVILGKLGNAFFNYMSLLGLAHENNMTLVLQDRSVLPQVLARPPPVDPDFDRKCSKALYVDQRKCCVLDERLLSLPHDDFYRVSGCLISWKYFRRIQHKVKDVLAFKESVMVQARKIVQGQRSRLGSNVTLVGMHVRRGDQSGLIAYMHGHNPTTPEYVTRATTYFMQRFPAVHFLVASNDADWCKDYVANGRSDVTIMEGNSAAVDLAALTLTDHMIVSIGTYGWWAGYLNPGIKTYMRDFVRAGTLFSRSFDDVDAKDYVYPGWVPL